IRCPSWVERFEEAIEWTSFESQVGASSSKMNSFDLYLLTNPGAPPLSAPLWQLRHWSMLAAILPGSAGLSLRRHFGAGASLSFCAAPSRAGVLAQVRATTRTTAPANAAITRTSRRFTPVVIVVPREEGSHPASARTRSGR